MNFIIADDHNLFRSGLKYIISHFSLGTVIEETDNGMECLDLIKDNENIDIIIVDADLPEISGFDLVSMLRKENIYTPAIILSDTKSLSYIMKARDLGIEGFLCKNATEAELEEAILKVSSKSNYIQPELMPLLNSGLVKRDMDSEKLESLTKRELEVLKIIAAGKFNREIALTLNISERTVKNHISNIFKKIDVADRTQAAVFAIRNNLIQVH